MLVATLIAANATSLSGDNMAALTEDDYVQAANALAAKGLIVTRCEWIDKGKALDICIDGQSDSGQGAMQPRIAGALSSFTDRCDIAVQYVSHREKSLFLSDMDSTMIGQECIDELADYAGVRDEITAITERAMRGELDFAASLRERVAKLANLDEALVAECLHQRVTPNAGAKTLLATLRAKNVHCLLVSGGFHHFADHIGADLGFHGVHANRLDVKDGKLTGGLIPPLFGAQSKADILAQVAAAKDIDHANSFAVGDGANDLPMLDLAGLSIGYHAKPVVNEAVDFPLRHNDLSAILYALGIPSSEWQVTS